MAKKGSTSASSASKKRFNKSDSDDISDSDDSSDSSSSRESVTTTVSITDKDVPSYGMEEVDAKLLEILLTHVKLMLDRRYRLDNDTDTKVKLVDDDAEFLDRKEFFTIKTNDPDKNSQIYYVKLIPDQQINTVYTKTSAFTSLLNKKGRKIILCESYQPSVIKKHKKYNCEFFEYQYFLDDTFEALDRPRYTLLTKKQVERYYASYLCRKEFCQTIHSTDINAKYYGFKNDDVVKIVRKSPSAIYGFTYKLIIEKIEK